MPELVNFNVIVSSKCTSPICPKQNREVAKRCKQIVIRNPTCLTQEELDSCLTMNHAICDEPINDEIVVEHGEDMFQLRCNVNVDTEETEGRYVWG